MFRNTKKTEANSGLGTARRRLGGTLLAIALAAGSVAVGATAAPGGAASGMFGLRRRSVQERKQHRRLGIRHLRLEFEPHVHLPGPPQRGLVAPERCAGSAKRQPHELLRERE